VVRLAGVEHPEGVQVAVGHELVEPVALDAQKARGVRVLLGPGEVDFLVGGVEVPADDNGLFLAQFLGIVEEAVVEAELVGQALGVALAVGEVDVEQVEIRVFEEDEPALALVGLQRQAHAGGQGLRPGDGGHARIALLFLAVVPEGLVARGAPVVVVELVRMALGFLEADHVGVRGPEPVPEVLLGHGPEAVDVPGIEFHAQPS